MLTGVEFDNMFQTKQLIITRFCYNFANIIDQSMTLHLRILASVAALLTAMLPATANLQFQDLELNTRLSSNMINTIFQDSQGLLYFGTATGLNRYDGYAIEVYRQTCDDGPADNYVSSIQEAPDGNLWVKMGGGYVIFHPDTKEFSSVKEPLRAMGVDGNAALVRIEGPRFWIRTHEGNLFLYDNGKLDKVADPTALISSHDITAMQQIAPGRLIAANSRGKVLVIDIEKMSVHETLPLPGAEESYFIHNLFIDNDKNIWVYGVDGLWVLDYSTGKWLDNYRGHSLDMPIIKDLAHDQEGALWIAYEHDGLSRISTDGTLESSHDTANPGRRLSSNSLTALLADRTGTLWIGSRKSGISSYHPNGLQFEHYPIPDTNCEVETENGDVWIGTDSEGLLLWNPITGIKKAYKEPFVKGNDVNAIVCITPAADGSLWIGTYNGGIVHYHNGTFTSYTTANGLVNDNAWTITVLDDGNLLIGTLGGGLQLFSPTHGSIKNWTINNSHLGSDYIGSISSFGKNRFAIGTSYGLTILDLDGDTMTNLQGNTQDDMHFTHPNINQAFVDSRGLIWLATYSGLNVLDLDADRVYALETKDQAPEFILGVQEDADGNIWASIGNNLVYVKVSGEKGDYQFDMRRYDEHDGLQRGDFNQRSFCLLSNGELLVGGLKGVNAFRPSALSQKTVTPRVFFTVEPREHNGAFFAEFASDDYLNPEKTLYAYMLEGWDKEWTTLPQGVRSLNFANIAPGNYTLRVKAINDNGMESEPVAATIHVPAPWYRQWWSLMIWAIIIATLIYLSYIFVKRRERLIYMRREKEESARKQEELNQMKFKFFTNISHELRTPLTLITAPLDTIMKRNQDEVIQRHLGIIQANANRLLNLVNQLLDFRKSEMSGLTLHASSGDIVAFVRNICDSFMMFADKKNIPINYSSSMDSLYMDFDEDKMGKIVMNLLSNALKFTPDGGKVDVSVERDGNDLTIKVADTGVGISDEAKKHVFERFYQAAESLNSHISGSGIGLSLVAEYAKVHNGKVEVIDNQPKGTIFIVTIPIKQALAPTVPEPTEQKPETKDQMPKAKDQNDLILLVDDNNDLLDFVSSELSDEHNIMTAHDGNEALEAIKQAMPDLIISDIMMPGMDGIELCRQLKANPDTAAIPLLLLTAKHDVAAKIEGLTLGADDYMTKPFNMDVLQLRIRALLGLRKKGMRRPMIELEPEPIKITSLDEKLVEKCVKYVQEQMDDPELSVEKLSDHVGMSRVHLYKKLKQITGKTPIEFIRILRLKRAAQLLRESQLTVAEIAYQTGFNSPKYFSKYFRDEFGMIPSQYQNECGK